MVLENVRTVFGLRPHNADSLVITERAAESRRVAATSNDYSDVRSSAYSFLDSTVQLVAVHDSSSPDRCLGTKTNSSSTSYAESVEKRAQQKVNTYVNISACQQWVAESRRSLMRPAKPLKPTGFTSQIEALVDPNYVSKALQAAASGNVALVKHSIDVLGVPVDAETVHGSTMLHVAVRGDHLDCVLFLIKCGADIRRKTERGRAPFHSASANGAARCLKLLLKCLCDEEKVRLKKKVPATTGGAFGFLLQPDNEGNTALHLACRQSSKQCLKLIIRSIVANLGWPSAEEALQCVNAKGESPLHVACVWRSVATTRCLLNPVDAAQCITKGFCRRRYAKNQKIARTLVKASTSTLQWSMQIGSILHEMCAVRCTCREDCDSRSSREGSLSRFGAIDTDVYYDDDLDVPERRCIACDRAQHLLVKLLVRSDVRLINLRDRGGRTPLMNAVVHDSVGVVNALLELRVDVEDVDSRFRTALHHSASRGVSRQVSRLLSKGACASAADGDGYTPMHYAALRGFTSSLRFLYRANKFIDVPSLNGHTAFMWAAMNGADSSLRTMLDANPLLNRREKATDGSTSLHLAAAADRAETVKMLVRCAWNAEVRNDNGETAFLTAASHGSVRSIRALFECGVDVFAADKFGNTALHLASKSSASVAALQELLTWLHERTFLNRKNAKGKTALQVAVEGVAVRCVRVLLDCGADCRIRDAGGRDALMAAIKTGRWSILTLLLKNSPNYNCYSPADGQTTLSLSMLHNNTVLTDLLKESGAKMPAEFLDDAARKIQRWYRAHLFVRRLLPTPGRKGHKVRQLCATLGESMLRARTTRPIRKIHIKGRKLSFA